MIPLIGFAAGVVISELWQWGAWKLKHTDESLLGYWKVGLPHLMMNLLGDVAVACLWSADLLDDAVGLLTKYIPGTAEWANVGLPYTPQIGVILGMLSDMFSDNLAYLVRKVFSKWLPSAVPATGGSTAPNN